LNPSVADDEELAITEDGTESDDTVERAGPSDIGSSTAWVYP